MAKEKKEKPEKEPINRPERYKKSDLAIKGTFDEAMNVFFRKAKNKETNKKLNDVSNQQDDIS